MILPDVNVLAAAFRPDAQAHPQCRGWLDFVVKSETRLALSPIVLASVIRIATNRRIFDPPSATSDAIGFCDDLMSQRNSVVIHPGTQHWSIFSRLCVDSNATGNLVTDAWIAALAIEWGCELVTFDKDFQKFSGIRVKAPMHTP